jgi:threonine synthase
LCSLLMDYWKGIIHHYREYLPVNENTPIITLYEGNTPLVHAQNFITLYPLATRATSPPTEKLPKMMGWQAEGAAPIVKGYPIKNPQTIATAIKIGNPYSWLCINFS